MFAPNYTLVTLSWDDRHVPLVTKMYFAGSEMYTNN